ncbi:MAG TPA: hypothetical protein VF275_13185 [Gammaproteobacteria bacterium]
MKNKLPTIVGVLMAGCLAFSIAMADEPAHFVELDRPDAVRSLGETSRLLLFRDASASGVRLQNASDVAIHIQDVVSLATLTLAPGMQLSLACESMRHLAVTVNDNVVYESASCGSLLRFADAGGVR